MKKYAIINLWKTSTRGPIHVVATSDNLAELQGKMKDHDEIVMCFTEGGRAYYSRDLDKCVKTFIAR